MAQHLRSKLPLPLPAPVPSRTKQPADKKKFEQKKFHAARNKLYEKWGEEKVQHYTKNKGRGYVELLASVCAQCKTWEEYVTKINQILVRRDQRTAMGNRKLRCGIDRIDKVDLKHVLKWQDQQAYEIEDGISLPYASLSAMPPGFGFDKYGIIMKVKSESPANREPSKTLQQFMWHIEELSRIVLDLEGTDEVEEVGEETISKFWDLKKVLNIECWQWLPVTNLKVVIRVSFS